MAKLRKRHHYGLQLHFSTSFVLKITLTHTHTQKSQYHFLEDKIQNLHIQLTHATYSRRLKAVIYT